MNCREIKELLKSEGFSYTKSLGQNFIFDARILTAIVDASGVGAGESVLEIGPGAATLTSEIARRAGKVVSVEKDARLTPFITRVMEGADNFTLVNADFLELDLASFAAAHFPGGYSVIANLPYYITTPILFSVFESGTDWHSLTVMVQREVAARLCAAPGTKDYGALTCAVGFYATAKTVLSVPRGIFTPPPDVDSVVVRLDRRPVPAVKVKDEKMFFRAVRAGFAMRRKTILNNLCSAFSLTRPQGEEILSGAGIDPSRRGETLTSAEYAALADKLTELQTP